MADERPAGVKAAWRRPIVRAVLIILLAVGIWGLWRGQQPWATVAIVNATDAPLHDVTLVLEDTAGGRSVEQVPTLGPDGRWEHRSPQTLLRIASISFTHAGEPRRIEDLGEVEAGQVVTLSVRSDGSVRRTMLYLSR